MSRSAGSPIRVAWLAVCVVGAATQAAVAWAREANPGFQEVAKVQDPAEAAQEPPEPPGASDGVASDGVAPDGVASDGVAPDGVAPDGVAFEGTLRAYPLRGLTAEVAALILRADPGGRMLMAALAAPCPGASDKVHVPVFVEIDGPSFLDTNQSETARLEVYAYALDPEQRVAGYLAEGFAVDVSDLGETLFQSGLKYYGHLDLAPGRYTVRILVRNARSKAAGLTVLTVTVPHPQPSRSVVSTPLVPGPRARDAWVRVEAAAGGREEGCSALARRLAASPSGSENEVLNPQARPVIVARRRTRVYLFSHRLPQEIEAATVELLGPEGKKPVATARAEVLERSSGGALEVLSLGFAVPDLEAAEYPLRIRFEAPGVVVDSPPIPVWGLPRTVRERDLLWVDLRGSLDARTPRRASGDRPADGDAESSTGAGRPRGGRRVKKLAAVYRQAVASLARGETSVARAKLLELETSILNGPMRNGADVLRAAEYRVAKQLAEADAESLLPLLMLHDDLYRAYRSRRLFSLAFHSRSMMEALGELYAEHGRTEESGTVAAQMFSSLAGYLQEANLPSNSRKFFERALQVHPENQAALVGLASSYERHGEYRRALGYLEQATAADPRFSEGLLRLAVNLNRTTVTNRARSLFEEIIRLDGPAWVKSLAHQELARSYLRTGALEQAAEVLRQAMEAMPDDRGCSLLLAHVYDRMKRPDRARDVLAELEPRPVGVRGELSPRRTYDTWPSDSVRRDRRSLTQSAATRVEALSRAMTSVQAQER